MLVVNNDLIIELLDYVFQLHYMHVELTSFDVVDLMMYVTMTYEYALVIWYSLVECA